MSIDYRTELQWGIVLDPSRAYPWGRDFESWAIDTFGNRESEWPAVRVTPNAYTRDGETVLVIPDVGLVSGENDPLNVSHLPEIPYDKINAFLGFCTQYCVPYERPDWLIFTSIS